MYLRFFIAALFLLFAYFQWNDPDPWLWILAYGGTAMVCIYSAFKTLPKWFYLAGLGLVLVGVLFLLPDFVNWIQMGMPTIAASMKAEAPHIELTREFLGLVIIGGCWFWLSRNKSE